MAYASLLIPASTEETRVEEKQEEFFCFSAGAYTTNWLVMVTKSQPVAVSKQDF
jgi:hypothetical protein